MNNMFMVQPININFSCVIERVRSFVQVPKTPFKGTPSTYPKVENELISSCINYVSNSPLDLVPKIIRLLSRKFGHSHSYKTKNNLSRTRVHNTLMIKTKLTRSS